MENKLKAKSGIRGADPEWAELVREIAAQRATENGGDNEIALADAFILQNGPDWKYDSDQDRWYKRDGGLWKKQTKGAAFNTLKNIVKEDLGTSKKVHKAAFISGAEIIAKKSAELEVRSDIWDNDPMLLGTPSGVIDLLNSDYGNPHILPAPREAFVTKSTSCDLAEANSPASLWAQFLNDSTGGDQDLIRFLQQIAGYLLTGDTSEHAMFMIYGPGGNGKSVFINTICRILGDYSRTSGMDMFMQTRQDRHPTEWAALKGARLVSASETQEGRTWAENRIKQATGGDPITARFMRQDEFTYLPQFKLIIVGNHEPNLGNVDDAIRRRFNIIPFTRKPTRVDKDLEAKLTKEHGSILRWMIDGCRDWQDHGLIRPEVVTKQTGLYFAEQDILGRWIDEQCLVGKEYFEPSGDLFKSWAAYVSSQGEKAGTQRSFSQALAKRGFAPGRLAGGNRTRVFEGLRLVAATSSDPDWEVPL